MLAARGVAAKSTYAQMAAQCRDDPAFVAVKSTGARKQAARGVRPRGGVAAAPRGRSTDVAG